MALKLQIVTPNGDFYNGECTSVTLSTIEGQITVLEKHAPLVAPLDYCKMYIKGGTLDEVCALGGGILYIDNEGARVITDSVIEASKINVATAEKQKREAEERIANNTGDIDIDLAKVQLARAINELRVKK